MTETTPLYESISNVYNGPALGIPNRDIFGQGIVKAGDLAVSAHGGANSIDVAAGSCWVVGDTDVVRQPTYRCYNDAIVNLGISPDPTNPRRVLVVAQLNDADFVGGARNWQLTAIHGTPAGSPVLPAEPASAMSLANILVPAAAASSAAYTITDLRSRARLGGQVDRFYTGTLAAGPPANPQDGDVWVATAADGATAGVRWTFMYNAASASAYKWEFIGGSEFSWYDTGGVTRNNTANAAWQQIPGSATFTLLRGGDYHVKVKGIHIVNAVGVTLQVGIGPLAAPYTATMMQGAVAAQQQLSLQQEGTVGGVAANQVVGITMSSSAFGNTGLNFHGYSIVPIRVA